MMRKEQPGAYREWIRIVTQQMPHLSKPQALGLAMWSFAMIVTHRCGLTSASVFLAELLERPAANIREQLRQWYNGAWRKGERSRSEINVSESFAPLLQWILRRWSPGEKNLVLAADASTLGQRFTILVISVVY